MLINAIIPAFDRRFLRRVTVGDVDFLRILDIVNIAHRPYHLGSYIATSSNQTFGVDPILTAILVLPAF